MRKRLTDLPNCDENDWIGMFLAPELVLQYNLTGRTKDSAKSCSALQKTELYKKVFVPVAEGKGHSVKNWLDKKLAQEMYVIFNKISS
jgi:hypothetical protein